MNLALENLDKITEILEKLNSLESKISGEKRWLNTKEASYYLGYSKDHIHKLKESHLVEGVHCYKKAGRILFDKVELDNWVKFALPKSEFNDIVNNILEDLK